MMLTDSRAKAAAGAMQEQAIRFDAADIMPGFHTGPRMHIHFSPQKRYIQALLHDL